MAVVPENVLATPAVQETASCIGMHGSQMINLEERLQHHFAIALNDMAAAGNVTNRVRVKLPPLFCDRTHVVFQWLCVCILIEEYPLAERLAAYLLQTVAVEIQFAKIFPLWNADQPAFQIVPPAVKRAGKSSFESYGCGLDQWPTTMLACVVEGTDPSIPATHDHYW